MFVIARLATRHGIAVTLRSSPYGGTTAIVLIPHEIVVPEPTDESAPGASPAVDASDADDVAGGTGALAPKKAAALAERAGRVPSPVAESLPGIPPARSPEPEPVTADLGGLTPLPRRVPQTSLASELREEAGQVEEDTELEDFTAERAASSLAGFQRGTFQARDEDAQPQYDREEAAASSTPPADRS
jgi:hypothetical protein